MIFRVLWSEGFAITLICTRTNDGRGMLLQRRRRMQRNSYPLYQGIYWLAHAQQSRRLKLFTKAQNLRKKAPLRFPRTLYLRSTTKRAMLYSSPLVKI